jgi:hypothetical protein
MDKQDRQGVRTPADVERKYNLGRLAAAQDSSAEQNEQIERLSQELAQFIADTNGKFQALDRNTETFFYSGVPTLENAPAVNWNTNDVKSKHVGDLYFNKDDGSLYLFNGDGINFEWLECSGGDLEDSVLKSELLSAIDSNATKDQVYNAQVINKALDSLDSKVAKTDIETEIDYDLDAKDKIYNVEAINAALMDFEERLQELEKGSGQLLDYTVTFIVDGETYEIVSVKQGNSVDAPSVEPTSDEGNFAGWYIEGERVTFPFTPTANTEILAEFSSLITMLYEHYAISEADYPYIFIFYNGSYIYPYFANACTVSSGSISLSGVKDTSIRKTLTDASDTTELVNAILEHTPSLSSATYNNAYNTKFTYYANFDLSSFGTYYSL